MDYEATIYHLTHSGLANLHNLIRSCHRIPSEASEQQRYYNLAGLDGPSPYTQALRRIDHLIGQLKKVRQEVQELQSHAHEWDSDSYCIHCGADGLA